MNSYEMVKDYKISAHIFNDNNLYIDIGFLGNHPKERLFLINKFKQTKENKKIFKELFEYFSCKEKNEDFIDFFANQDYFFAIFNYKEEANFNYKFNKLTCEDIFETRIKIFESLLIKIYNILIQKKKSKIILKNIIKTENIFLGTNDSISFNYDLREYKLLEKENEETIFEKMVLKKIARIISVIFEIEATSKYNKIIQIILKKCEIGLYPSIPSLVVEFKKNSDIIKVSSFLTFVRYHIELRKPTLFKIINSMIIPIFIVAFIYLMYTNFVKKDAKVSREIVIGATSYTSGTEDTKNKLITPDKQATIKNSGTSGENLKEVPFSARLDFEDYVVKNKDTLESIANTFFGDVKYSKAIASFNKLRNKETLTPGTLLRIPTKSSLARFLESN